MSASLLLLAQVSCDESNPVAPTDGSLAISVTGLPAHVDRALTVTGPSGTFEITTNDTVLRHLEPGTYTLDSPVLWVTTGRYVPDGLTRTAEVIASRTPAVTAVAYALWDSRLSVAVSGLPSTGGGNIEISGPSFSTTVTHSQTFGDLKAGDYTLTSHDVIVGGITYRGAPASQVVTLPPGNQPVTASFVYTAVTAQLSIAPGVLPTGIAPGTSIATVSGPNGFNQPVVSTQPITGLQPGTYTVTANTIVVDGISYVPSPTTQQATLTAGMSGSAALIFRGQLDLERVPIAALSGGVYLTAPSGDARLFIVQRGGFVRVVRDGQLLATPFLDISSRISTDGERGLLSIAFDPLYATNGYVYAYFTDLLGDIVIERFASTPGADVADPTPKLIVSIPHRDYNNHNGGLLMFGPDGLLYTATGDGGGGGDPQGNAQNPSSRLGKMLRINVRFDPAAVNIWATGLRNPWRFDFDAGRFPDLLYIADVGQDRYEEINAVNITSQALNFGWNVREGAHCYPSGEGCLGVLVFRDPVFEYSHTQGCSIVGGFVYRGAIVPLRDKFTFSDFCGGWLSTLNVTSSGYARQEWSIPAIGNVVSFGEDGLGEQYVINAPGELWKVVRK